MRTRTVGPITTRLSRDEAGWFLRLLPEGETAEKGLARAVRERLTAPEPRLLTFDGKPGDEVLAIGDGESVRVVGSLSKKELAEVRERAAKNSLRVASWLRWVVRAWTCRTSKKGAEVEAARREEVRSKPRERFERWVTARVGDSVARSFYRAAIVAGVSKEAALSEALSGWSSSVFSRVNRARRARSLRPAGSS